MRIETSNIVTAFNNEAIGTKVTDSETFMAILADAIKAHDFSKDTVPGQGFLLLPDAVPFVSAGVGPRSTNPNDYVCRLHRSRVDCYLKREFAAPVEGCAAVVYSLAAYLADPDLEGETEEIKRITDLNPAYVIVAVLAFAGPKAALSPYRLTANLAGGNLEAQVWDADKIRQVAKDSKSYDDAWATVAD